MLKYAILAANGVAVRAVTDAGGASGAERKVGGAACASVLPGPGQHADRGRAQRAAEHAQRVLPTG